MNFEINLILLISLFIVFGDSVHASKAQFRKIVQMHNEFRQKLVDCPVPGLPAPKSMPKLQWDESLVEETPWIIKTCSWNFSQVHTYDELTTYGINIAFAKSGQKNWEYAVEKWFKEAPNYKYVRNFCRGICDHFVTISCQKSTKIYCSVKKCERGGYDIFHCIYRDICLASGHPFVKHKECQ